MNNRKSSRMLCALLFSTAALGATAGSAFAGDVASIYGRSSQSDAMGATVNAAVPEDVSNVYGRAPEAEQAADEARYDLSFTLVQGAHQDDLPPVDAWQGRAAAPTQEDATWKITTQSVDKSGSPHG
jgi:hypothetical protein